MEGIGERKMCNCIATIIKKTEQRKHAIQATVGSFNTQKSGVSYRPITRAGVPSKHNGYSSVPWKYCPWCGQQIEANP